MKFKEVQQADGTIKYYMGQNYKSLKEVSEETYKKLLEDDTSDSITIPKVNVHEIETYSKSECNDDEFCQECQEILDLIFDLNEMDEREAIDTFKSIIHRNRQEAFLEGLISAYDNIGSLANKISARYENQLDDLQDDYDEEE